MTTRETKAWTIQIDCKNAATVIAVNDISSNRDVYSEYNRVIAVNKTKVFETTVLATNEADARFLAYLVVNFYTKKRS